MADRVEVIVNLVGKDEAISGLQEILKLANQTNGSKAKVEVDASGARRAEGEVRSLHRTLGNVIKGVGTFSQTVGGLLTTTSFAMRRTGMMFTQMSQLFGGSILNKAMYTVAGKAVNLFSQGLQGAVNRFDTFRTFPKLMQTIGFSIEDSTKTVERLNEAVLGTPTSLTEMINTATPFIQMYNDVTKGADLAIAANNAFLASGADAASKATGLSQIRDILSKGDLTGTEWDSLFMSMGVSLNYIGEQMGYSRDEMDKFRAALQGGEISAYDFLDAMIATGTGTGQMAKAASLSTEQLGSAIENTKTAFSNLGATVLEAFDEILKENTGKGLAENITALTSQFKQNVIPAVADFVRAHGDDIMGFFGKLRSFPWGDLVSQIKTNIGGIFDVFGNIVDKVGMDRIVKFVAFATTWASPLGRALRLLAAPVGILGSLMTRFGGLERRFGGWLSKRGGGAAAAGGAARSLRGTGTSLLGAAGFVGIIAELGLVIAEYAKVAEYVGSRDFGNLDKNIGPLMSIMTQMTGVTAAITGVMTGLQKAGLGVDVAIGEGLTAGFMAIVGFVGEVVGVFSEVGAKISGANLDNLDANWSKLDKFMGNITVPIATMVAGFGALTGFTGGVGGLAAAAGELLTAGFIELLNGMADTLGRFTDLAANIASVEMPSDAQLSRLGEVFNGLEGLFEQFDIGLSWFEKSSFDRAIDALTQIVDSFAAFEAADQIKANLDNAGKNLETVVETMGEISNIMLESFDDYDASTTTEQQAQIAENMSSVVTSLSDTATTMNTMKTELDKLGMAFDDNGEIVETSKFGKIRQGIETLATSLGDLFTTIATSFGSSSWRSKAKNSELQGDVMENMREILTSLQETIGIFDQIDNLLPSAGLWSQNPEGIYAKFEKTKNGLTELIEGIGLVSSTLEGAQTELESSAELMKTENQAGIVQNMNTIMTGLGEIMTTFSTFDLSKTGMTQKSTRGGYRTKFDDMISDVREMIRGIDSVMKVISEGGLIKSLLDRWESANEDKIVQNLQSSLEGINNILGSIGDVSLSAEGLDVEKFKTISEKVSQVMEDVDVMMDAITGATTIGRGETNNKSYEDISADLQQLYEAMTHIQLIVAKLQGMMDSMQEVADNEGTFKLGQIIRGITTSLSAIPEDAADIQERVANMKAAIDSVKELIQNIVDMKANMDAIAKDDATGQMQGILGGVVTALGGADIEAVKTTLATLSAAMGGLRSNLENLAAVDLSGLSSAVDTLYGSMGNLNGELQTCAAELGNIANGGRRAAIGINAAGNAAEDKRGAIMAFNFVVSALSSSLGGAAASARALGAAIAALQSKTVTVTYRENRTVTTNNVINTMRTGLNRLAGIMRSGGGIVPQYRAIGGMMRPRGTDTVPAMLTPGEFVMRRAAVQRLGLDFMERINRMDIPGAISALMQGVRVPGGGITYNNQRTYDNHATINQYFPKGKKDKRASYRRASRALSAL